MQNVWMGLISGKNDIINARLPQCPGKGAELKTRSETPDPAKAVNLMQFARRAGKLVHGFEACQQALGKNKLHLLVLAGDTSQRTAQGIMSKITESNSKITVLTMSSQAEISFALGLPLTGVFGISDKNFAEAVSACFPAD